MDSNHQHPRCKRGALPIELITLNFGIKGFEPLNTRTKNEGLTAWLYPMRIKNYFETPKVIKKRKSYTLGISLKIR